MRKRSKISQQIEYIFESAIWGFRFFVLMPVIFGLLSSLMCFILGTLDVWSGLVLIFNLGDPEEKIGYEVVSHIIGGVDYYLIGIVLLIFALGIYELFISKINVRFKMEEPNNMQSRDLNLFANDSLEDLKAKLVKVIVVALIVSLFKKMLIFSVTKSIDLVYVGFSILLISLSQYLLHQSNRNGQ